jgi:cell filamentation protein
VAAHSAPAEKKRLPAPIYAIEKKRRTRNLEPHDVAWDDYLIPGTETLRNKLGTKRNSYGITDPDVLASLEAQLSMSRMLELQKKPIAGDFGYEHMKRIHEHLFQDVYEWAGKPRTVGMQKEGHSYAPPKQIDRMWAQQNEFLTEDAMLRGITDPDEFASKFAEHWGAVNVAHSFREGNTRSQTMYFKQLADEAGWELDVTMLDPRHPESIRDEFIAARFYHQNHGYDQVPLAQALSKALTRREPELQRTLHPGKDRGSVPHQHDPELTVDPNPPGSDIADRYRLPTVTPPAEALPWDLDESPVVDPDPNPPGADIAARYRRYPELAPDSETAVADQEGPER